MKIDFYKYSATRNDFVIIDNRNEKLSIRDKSLIQKICDRRSGVGSDGLILIDKSDRFDFVFSYANADGIEASMCGNGARAATHFAITELFLGKEKVVNFMSQAGLHTGELLSDDEVKVKMANPLKLAYDLSFIEDEREAGYINTGVPHLCLLSSDLDKEDILKIGSHYRYHEAFSPDGVNVNFVQRLSESEVEIRTYERGVEGETDACGTGAMACAIIFGSSVGTTKVKMKGGELLISFENGHYFLSGRVDQVFRGVY